jgi:hypothetical protein
MTDNRKRFDARRLLIAGIGVATVNYAQGCGGDVLFTSVANLMAPPNMAPPSSRPGFAGTTGFQGIPNPTPIAGANAADSGVHAAAGHGGQLAADDAGLREDDAGTPR